MLLPPPNAGRGLARLTSCQPLYSVPNSQQNREGPHNRPLRMRGHGQGGGAQPDRLPDDNRNEHGRFEWTDELRDDLMACYESSSPGRRGYMARMRDRWCALHPEHGALTGQHLRDYVAYLRRRGYVGGARLPDRRENDGTELAGPPPGPQVPTVDLGDRRALHHRKRPKPQDLASADVSLGESLPDDADIWRINAAVYQAALDVSRPESQDSTVVRAERRVRRMEAKIRSARQHASRIQCVVEYRAAGRPFTAKVRRIAAELRRVHHTLSQHNLQTIKQQCCDRVRMLVTAKKSLARRARGQAENKLFRENPSRLFQPPPRVVDNPPEAERVENFWRGIYEVTRPLRLDTPALAQFETFARGFQQPEQLCQPITSEEVRGALVGAKNFAAPGPDGINTYWWKKFPSTHQALARNFNSWVNEGRPIPSWFVEGRTILLPKNGDLSDPKNFRPITCLNACYKLFTRILYKRILDAMDPVFQGVYEQRGSKRGVAGCRENLLIDRCIAQDSVQYKRNLSMAWIDYRKAFDTTSHELIIKLLRDLAIPPPIVRCIEGMMPLWRTRFTITSGATRVCTDVVSFKRGVFQGDSLSPLLFCVSLLPLSVALRNTRGYMCGTPGNRRHKVTHLLYMDDLKIYASGKRDLNQSLRVVQEYTHAVGMEFGMDKCAMVHLEKGRLAEHAEDAQLVDGSILRHLGAGETYTYLGVAQSHVQEANTVKESLRGEYQRRLRQVWSSELSGKNKVAATNMFAVPVVTYSFGVVKWRLDELRQLDVKTRKMMTLHRSHHPKASVPRLYLPRNQGGRGLSSLECLHRRVVLSASCGVVWGADPLLRMVRHHETSGVGSFLFKAARRAADELNLVFDERRARQGSITELEGARLRDHLKRAEAEMLLRTHLDKPLHGVFFKNIEDKGLSKELTFAFLRSSGLKSETEGFIIACQDGVINTLEYRSRVMGVQVPDTSCRACRQAPETIMHLLSACGKYAVSAYIHRHNAALRVLYYHLRHSYGIDDAPVLPYAPGDIPSVVGNDRATIYWNCPFPTLRLVQANRPDIVLLDKENKAMYVIEFSAPADTNIAAKEDEKRTKYQDLLFDLRGMYRDHSVKLVVLIVGALGGTGRTLLSSLKTIPACRDKAGLLAGRMQRAVILGSLRLLRAHDSGFHDG